MRKNNRLLKISDITRIKLKELKFDLQSIEKKEVAMGEIVERTLTKENMERLKLGSMERRKGIR